MLWGLPRNVVLGTVHGLLQKSFHTLAKIGIVDLEQTVLKGSTARGIYIVANLIHPIGKCLKSSGVGGTLSTKESLLRETLEDLLCDIGIGLVQQFLDQFMGSCRIKNVVFDRNVFVVQLVNKSQGGDSLSIRPKTRFAELLSDSLILVRENM